MTTTPNRAISKDIVSLVLAAVALLLVFFTSKDISGAAKQDSNTDQLIRKIRNENKQLREQRPLVVELQDKVAKVSKLNSEITQPEAIEQFTSSAIERIVGERLREFERNWSILKSYEE